MIEDEFQPHSSEFEKPKYKVNDKILDDIISVLPKYESTSNFSCWLRDEGLVIGRNFGKECYDNEGRYNFNGAIARIVEGPATLKKNGLWIEFYKNAIQRDAESLFDVFDAEGIIEL